MFDSVSAVCILKKLSNKAHEAVWPERGCILKKTHLQVLAAHNGKSTVYRINSSQAKSG